MINFDNENKKKIIISILVTLGVIAAFVVYLVYTKQDIETYSLNDIIEEAEETEEVENTVEEKMQIVVHVTGEVKNEGIVYLEEGSRVVDAIEQAGGETEEADLSQINLAYVLSDGQKIYVPNKNEEVDEYITEGSDGVTEGSSTTTSEQASTRKGKYKYS